MKLAFAGTPAVAVETLKALIGSKHEISLVITAPPAPRGRSKELIPSEVEVFAKENNLEVFSPVSINSEESLSHLKSLDLDLVVVVAYGQLLKPATLATAKIGWVNAHFSLLPSWRGAAPAQAAIIHGDELTGVTTFLLDEGMDTGPVFGQVTTPIKDEETSGQLLSRLATLGADLILKTLEGIEDGSLKPVAQSSVDVSHATKLLPKDGKINWQNPALAISRKIRGCTPAPGAWTSIDSARIEIAPVEISDSNELAPGITLISKNEVLVGTGSFAVRLSQVKPAGKGWMNAADWARGLREPITGFDND